MEKIVVSAIPYIDGVTFRYLYLIDGEPYTFEQINALQNTEIDYSDLTPEQKERLSLNKRVKFFSDFGEVILNNGKVVAIVIIWLIRFCILIIIIRNQKFVQDLFFNALLPAFSEWLPKARGDLVLTTAVEVAERAAEIAAREAARELALESTRKTYAALRPVFVSVSAICLLKIVVVSTVGTAAGAAISIAGLAYMATRGG